ncbi:MAG: 6-bladed beta-propeller, partial [Armatimonadota bacterium]
IDRDGNLYVVDTRNNRVVVFNSDRTVKFIIEKDFRSLQDVAVDRQGRIYTLDAAGVPIRVFDKKGKYLYRFGFLGEGDQEISFPSAIFIDRNDQIWVVDKARHALKVFDRSGAFLRRFGSYGLGENSLSFPTDACADNLGRVYVVESGAKRLQVFSINRPFELFNPRGL